LAKKTLLNPPDSAEREYTRALLRLSRQIRGDVTQYLLPQLPRLVEQGQRELRGDSFSSDLAALLLELAQLALSLVNVQVATLPGRFEAVSKWNDTQFRMVVKANTGLDVPDVVERPGLGVNVFRNEPFLQPLAENWVKANTDLIKTLPTKLHTDLEGIIRRGVMNGASVKQLTEQIKHQYGVTDYRAKLIAQDQTLKLNADLTKYRLESVGVKRFVWRSVQDSRVRPEHVYLNGKTFAFDKPPSEGLPGQPVRCRCRAEGVWE
jgi:SPP1 gp7 family putative phage head morphogenesis protein